MTSNQGSSFSSDFVAVRELKKFSKQARTLNLIQKDLVFGTLLGDGNLQTSTSGKTWRYRALQKAEHESYLRHKYSVLQSFCNSPPIYGSTVDTRTKKTYTRWYFNTLVNPSLNFYANMFYRYDPKEQIWVKDVPLHVEKFLTARAIAYWYMDDGAIKYLGKSNGMRVCTERFSYKGVNRLKAALETKFGIVTTLTKKHKIENGVKVIAGYRITIPEKSSTAFRELIKPYLVDCMRYKVSDGNRGHL
jgi:hypothetical protein